MTKSSVIQLRVTEQQKAAIQARAKKNGKKVSQFLLDLALQGVNIAPDHPRLIEDPEQKAAEMVGQQERFAEGEAERLERGNSGKRADFPAMSALADVSGDDTPDAEDLRPEEPSREEVDALALTIHNTEGLPMRVALSTALHRLSR